LGILQKGKEILVQKVVGEKLSGSSDAQLAGMVRKLIPVVGLREVRRQTIRGIEKDLKKKAKRNIGIEVEALISEYTGEPEFMALWEEIGLELFDLEVLGKEALAKVPAWRK